MSGILFNNQLLGIQNPNGEFTGFRFNTLEEAQIFAKKLNDTLFGGQSLFQACNIMDKEEYERKQYENVPGIEEVNTTAKLDYNYYDGEGEQ